MASAIIGFGVPLENGIPMSQSPALAAPNGLRRALAERLSEMYAAEVPKYGHLVDAAARVNAVSSMDHVAAFPDLGDTGRMGSERHGAVRVANFEELGQLARLFGYYGMAAVGFYDLRTGDTPIPVVSTAFRPIDVTDMAESPFRMFTSTLVADDARFFPPEVQAELAERVAHRRLFSGELEALLDQADSDGGVIESSTAAFVDLTVDVFRLDDDPIDASWHSLLDAISPVASDIAAAAGTHLNHLTPRVADIVALHALMESEGVTMIDRIQGPPAWDGPDVLLRQTSFRALDEVRTFITTTDEDEPEVAQRTVRVRFGEVEQRGIALTPQGRAKVDAAMASITASPPNDEHHRVEMIRSELNLQLSPTIEGLAAAGDAYVEFRPGPTPLLSSTPLSSTPLSSPETLTELLDAGVLTIAPILYEDFLPASAAGIFASNLTHEGTTIGPGPDSDPDPGPGRADPTLDPSARDAERLKAAVGTLHDPYALYEQHQERSLADALATLGLQFLEPSTAGQGISLHRQHK